MKLPSKRLLMYSSAVALLGATVPFGGVAFAQAKPQMADDVFKNIKVLKGLDRRRVHGNHGPFFGRPERVLRRLPCRRRRLQSAVGERPASETGGAPHGGSDEQDQ